jgi:hypothetical protein
MYNIFLFTLVFNLAAWLIQIFALAPMSLPAKYNPLDIQSMFSLDVFAKNFTYVGIGVAAGLAALLLRQNVSAIYALVIFAVATFIPIVTNFIYAIPNMIDAIMLQFPEANPLSSVATGAFAGTNPYSLILIAIGYFAGFFFLMDKVTGGQTS